MRHGPVEHGRTIRRWKNPAQDTERTPGPIVVGIAALAFAACVANFALGVVAAIVALLAFGAGLSWFAMDRRRIRQAERDWLIRRPTRKWSVQGGEVVYRLPYVGSDDPGDQPSDWSAQQAAAEVGTEMKVRSGVVAIDGHRHGEPDPAATATLQCN